MEPIRMTPTMLLLAYQEFIQKVLTENDYKLRMPKDLDTLNQDGAAPDGTPEYETALPIVAIGNLPHSNFNGVVPGYMTQAHYVLVGMEEATDSDNDASMSLLLQVCLYSQDDYGNSGTPDNMAYLDALNLLQFLKREIVKKWTVGGLPLRKPISMGMYSSKALTWPHAFGYLSFEILMPAEAPETKLL